MTTRRRSLRAVLVALALLPAAARAGQPDVLSTTPARNSMSPGATVVAVTFDEPILPASITAASFRVFGRTSGPASGLFTFSNGDKTVTLTPSQAFAAGEVVIVNLAHSVQAADTTPLRSAGYAWQFTVATAPAARNFQQLDVMSNRGSTAQTRIYGAMAADLNRDGWVDLGTVNEVSSDVRVFLNTANGSGLFQQPFLTPFPIGLESSPNEPADFDNDGKIDAAISASSDDAAWMLRGNGGGSFTSSQRVETGSGPHGIVVLDVDGDADWDVVQAVTGDNHLALMLNDGSGGFGMPTFFEGGGDREYALGTADMNNDGIFDVVSGAQFSEEIIVALGNGDGTFTLAPAQDAGGLTWQLVVGDVDGDGNIDVASGNSFSNNGSILRGNGDGTLDLPQTVAMPAHTPASDLGDLDGDGDLDWVLSSYGAGLWRVFINDGAGTFSFDQDIEAPSNPSCAVPTDIDNDGDLDLVLTDEIADVLVVMQNANGPSPLCPAAPATCRAPVVSGKSSFQLKDKSPDTGDQVVWKWAGEITAKADYGNPVLTDQYALCLYDGGALVASATAPPGETCAGKPCWTEKPTSYGYRDKDVTPSGMQSIALKEGLVAGKAKITVKGKGALLDMPAPGTFAGPIAVRLHRSGGATCWGADFSPPFLKQDATIVKDKSD